MTLILALKANISHARPYFRISLVINQSSCIRREAGKKCARQHNLKIVYFAWSSTIGVNFCSALSTMAMAMSYVSMVGATPYELFLKVPWVNKQLASCDFTFRTRNKAAGVKYGR